MEIDSTGQKIATNIRGLELVSQVNDANQQTYYLSNAHGDILDVINSQGNILNNYKYDPFGNITEQMETLPNRYKYAGEQYDEVTGKYYLRARHYDPQVGRFMQEDTYRGDGLNLYTYVANNPLKYVDPSGHNKCANNSENSNGVIDFSSNEYIVNIKKLLLRKGSYNAMEQIMRDVEKSPQSFAKLKNSGSSKYMDFIDMVNDIVLSITPYTESYEIKRNGGRPFYVRVKNYDKFKEIHYFRNKLNWAPENLSDMIKLSQKKEWTLLPVDASIYHMYGTNGEYNLKFVSKNGHFEGVYSSLTKKLVTDPINMGTYNYAYPYSLNHFTYDVNPWKEFGNVYGILVPSEDTKAKFDDNKYAQKKYKEIKNQINKN
ncbi:RHS repeat-associated core domain-containing protein [Anaerovorax odorimutans]|uniref:RHS repeat-associated core domain-containing protein n=1 Tax=Anaerovorax odorimutans TaxID=109327 RepID=UPI000427044B|nr:RHS repeat-associated core domain-containing protein [Anaerovorax odorimutans]